MKFNKKKIAVVSLILCLAAILSLGSLAWFTDSDSIDNELKFVTDFEMDLYEHDDNGNIVYNKTGKETIGRTYDGITPGKVLKKDPTVVNKSSTENQFIRMTVTIDNASTWQSIVPENSKLTSIFTGFEEELWTRTDAPTVEGDTITYTFYLNTALAPGATATLFTGIIIPSSLTAEQAEAMGESHIIIDATAIQTTDLGSSVTDVPSAFALVEG